MPRDDQLLALIGQLYDVVLEPHRWPLILEAVSDLFGAAPVLFGHRDTKTAELRRVIVTRTNPEALELFMQDYMHPDINPLSLPLQTSAIGHILSRQAIIDDHSFRRTVVYNELFHPYGEIPLVAIKFAGGGSSKASLSLRAGALDKSLNTDENRALLQLIPHLQRVLQLEHRLAQSDNLSTVWAEALDHLQVGVIAVDVQGKVLLINKRAAAIIDLADGLNIAQRQLQAAHSDDTNTLHTLIHQAIETTTAEGTGAGGFLHLPRPSALRPLELLITPITRLALWAETRPPAALIFVTDPEQENELPAQSLQRIYGLTHTESEMAILMCQGHGLAYAAERLHVTLNTAKSHQRQIFIKTGVHRQAELVRVLLSSLARMTRP